VLAASTLIIGIPLPLGVVGHEGSTIIVVLNGLRLLGYGSKLTDIVHRTPEPERRTADQPRYQVTAA
jgi:hypothetical protein